MNLLLLDDRGRVRSQIKSVAYWVQRFNFDCNLVLMWKLIIPTPSALGLKPKYELVPLLIGTSVYTYYSYRVGRPRRAVHSIHVRTLGVHAVHELVLIANRAGSARGVRGGLKSSGSHDVLALKLEFMALQGLQS